MSADRKPLPSSRTRLAIVAVVAATAAAAVTANVALDHQPWTAVRPATAVAADVAALVQARGTGTRLPNRPWQHGALASADGSAALPAADGTDASLPSASEMLGPASADAEAPATF